MPGRTGGTAGADNRWLCAQFVRIWEILQRAQNMENASSCNWPRHYKVINQTLRICQDSEDNQVHSCLISSEHCSKSELAEDPFECSLRRGELSEEFARPDLTHVNSRHLFMLDKRRNVSSDRRAGRVVGSQSQARNVSGRPITDQKIRQAPCCGLGH